MERMGHKPARRPRQAVSAIGLGAAVVAAAVLLSCATGASEPAAAPTAAEAVAAAKERLSTESPSTRTNRTPLVLVHYMPWFSAPPTSDGYGYHWHMGGGAFDPYATTSDGRANIASRYYPLTGPYDSGDPAVLEYQAALMKLAGIDGAIFDWYGTEDALDYRGIHESAKAMAAVLKRAGLRFAVCYEDQSVGRMIEAKAIPREAAFAAGKKVMDWLAGGWFRDEAYVKIDGRPLLLCFGPQFFTDPRLWPRLFEGVSPAPYFVGLDDRTATATDGSFDWPPMWAAVGGILTPDRLVSYLNDFAASQASKDRLVATAFSGFHDAYREAGAGDGYGYLDYADGAVFDLTISAALAAKADVIQIATWNDYGEGTMIEPTIERGFTELEYLQRLRKTADPSFPYGPADLRAAFELYKLKATGAGPAAGTAEKARPRLAAADRAYAALYSGDAAAFRAALAVAGIGPSLAARPVLREAGAAVGGARPDPAAAIAAGKANIVAGRPAEASSHIYAFVAANAVDGDVRSYWEGASDDYPNALTVDLGAERSISGIAVRLNPQRIWGRRVQSFAVSTSLDGRDYAAAAGGSDYAFDPDTNSNVVAIPLQARGRYLRLTFTANTGAKAGQVAELEIYGD